jgi:hypothetical protein
MKQKTKKYFELYPVHPVKHIEVSKTQTITLEPTPVMIRTLKKCLELEIEHPDVPYGPVDVGSGFSGLFKRGLLDVKLLNDKGKTSSWFITRAGLRLLLSKLKNMCYVVIAKTGKGEVVCLTKKDSYKDCKIIVDNLEQLNVVYETTIQEIKEKNKPITPKKIGLVLTSKEYKNYVRALHENAETELHKVVKPAYYKSDLYIF